jgi:hypothetical protein
LRAFGRKFSVPLEQLALESTAADAQTALADWRYWVDRVLALVDRDIDAHCMMPRNTRDRLRP